MRLCHSKLHCYLVTVVWIYKTNVKVVSSIIKLVIVWISQCIKLYIVDMDWFVLFQHKESQKNEVMPFRHLIELNENSRAWRSNDKDQWPQEEVVASWYVDDRRVTASGYLKFVSQSKYFQTYQLATINQLMQCFLF